MIQKFRKKPVVVEAIRFDGMMTKELEEFLESADYNWIGDGKYNIEYLVIKTLEGNMRVSYEDYIIRGVNGEFYPCKPDIFEKTYEMVEE